MLHSPILHSPSLHSPSLQDIREQFKAIAHAQDAAELIATLQQARDTLSDADITMAHYFAYQDLNYHKHYDAADWLFIVVKNLRQVICLASQDLLQAA